ncbi:hypothetical protein [Kangiella sp. TOML190]|uniref:hypothetical protein n=1 Tax=Kangiella sp. TOML190 TaxID=2931351 RepID=UPI00203DEC27|nr:hypothetical protein [Kangiella sp. TOML190]
MKTLVVIASALMLPVLSACASQSHHGHIISEKNKDIETAFDLIHAKVERQGDYLVFQQAVTGIAGSVKPSAKGALAGADVYSYVWPTSLNSSAVGFEEGQGILALALTVHPDFDDTPLYDEDGDGNLTNDGDKWHSHWVVLTKDEACGAAGMKVKDIPEGTKPKLPKTWPGLPLFIDSPGFEFSLVESEVLVKVPVAKILGDTNFNFDSVTSALRVNQQVHAPLLCIVDVWDIASGDLSLPGTVK